jgi:hypothetical protein
MLNLARIGQQQQQIPGVENVSSWDGCFLDWYKAEVPGD